MWELLGKNASEIIALSAFALAVYQLYLTRKSSKISVVPHISHYASTTRNEKSAIYDFEVANTGMGPAKITSWRILLDGLEIGKSEYRTVDNYLNYLCAGKKNSLTVGNLSEGHMLATNERCKVLRVQIEVEKQSHFYSFKKNLDRLDLEVDYLSVYGDRYFMSTRNEVYKLLQPTTKAAAE